MATTTMAQPRRKRGLSETVKNYWVDIVLFLAFIIDMNTHFTGIPIHEWLGLGFGIALIYHMMLHWKWITSVTTRLLTKQPGRQRIRSLINLALFIDMVVIVITGIWISEAALPFLGVTFTPNHFFDEVHHVSSELAVLLVSAHIALDWKWIVKNTKRYILRKSNKQTQEAAE